MTSHAIVIEQNRHDFKWKEFGFFQFFVKDHENPNRQKRIEDIELKQLTR